jgi:molybdate transport system substrate-binding protein
MRRNGFILMVALAILGFRAPAGAAELHVLAGGAVQEAVSELARTFERDTGHKIVATYAPMGTLQEKIAADGRADLLVMTAAALDDLERKGTGLGTRKELGRVGIGVAVREGAPKPDISTPEALRTTLLAAKSITYADPARGATSGMHFASVLEKLGIKEQVAPKTKLQVGGFVVELVAKGEVEIGIQQMSEIVPVKGVTLLGPLPGDLQRVTPYLTVVPKNATAAEIAAQFQTFLVSENALAALKHGGLEPPK